MPDHSGNRKIRNIAIGNSHRRLQDVGERTETASQNDSYGGAQGRGVPDEISSALHVAQTSIASSAPLQQDSGNTGGHEVGKGADKHGLQAQPG